MFGLAVATVSLASVATRGGAEDPQLKLLRVLPADPSTLLEYRWDFPNWWHGQVGQDYRVIQILQGLRGGFFVDLAANLPVKNSNTRALERDYGWQGICIDGNLQLALNLAAGRKCRVVRTIVSSSVSSASDMEIEVSDETIRRQKAMYGYVDAGLGHAVNHINATRPCAECQRTASLERVLDELGAPEVIDYLSLDLESFEDMALLHFPFKKYRFNVINIEQPSHQLTGTLLRHGYHRFGPIGWFGDTLFIHNDVPGGLQPAIDRATNSTTQWFETLRSAAWTSDRSGWAPKKGMGYVGVSQGPLPFFRGVVVACCGIPASFVAAGSAMPAPSPEFEGKAPSTCHEC